MLGVAADLPRIRGAEAQSNPIELDGPVGRQVLAAAPACDAIEGQGRLRPGVRQPPWARCRGTRPVDHDGPEPFQARPVPDVEQLVILHPPIMAETGWRAPT
jgi:hypothetical protein